MSATGECVICGVVSLVSNMIYVSKADVAHSVNIALFTILQTSGLLSSLCEKAISVDAYCKVEDAVSLVY